ncbi:MAG TPA: thiamine pyrophosphate-dependent enzyme, partial [Burkholderiales bacterium]|nr:thiamine pyrophosphate-dependent enzyme [Burkholderiales bacterium]
TVNYTLFDIPRLKQKFIHVHPGAEELGRVYQGDLLINSGMPEFAAAARALEPVKRAWDDWTQGARADLEAWQQPVQVPGKVNMSEVIHFLRAKLPKDAIITNGAGNFSLWAHRFYQYGGFRTQLAPTSGAMGYGVPAAVAAKIIHPERTVVAFAGDGDFLMTGQELATAAQYDAKVLFIVVNNGMYGTIRMHQEREFPGRVSGTMLKNPDFAALARAYGFHGETVEATADFQGAFERAQAAKGSALIEVRIDPEAINPRTTLSAIRAEAMKTKGK